MKRLRAVLAVVGLAMLGAACGKQTESGGDAATSTMQPPEPSGDVVTNSMGMKLRLIQPGKFMMGSPDDEHKRGFDETQHEVVLTKPYYIGVCEVTQAEFEEVMGTNPSKWKGAELPVEGVSWNEAVEFCEKLSAKEPGVTYRLPTEAEWEYACRAGGATRFYWGDDLNYSPFRLSDRSEIRQYAFFVQNSGGRTNEVGQKKPNTWGLYDMSGNVWEWTQDYYANDYPAGCQTDPKSEASAEVRASWRLHNEDLRVLRGGSWRDHPRYCRSASRFAASPTCGGYSYLGFRVARTP